MGFGTPLITAILFDNFPIGAGLTVGEDSSFWVGNFGGIQSGVAVLTNARLFSNIGTPIDGIRPVVRIPINQITFVS
jgi:6Fe-6S prismane cluster-containing protein